MLSRMILRAVCATMALGAVGLLGGVGTAGASAQARSTGPSVVTVGGAVSAPAAYSPAQLAALPQSSARTAQPFGLGGVHTIEGVSLEQLVNLSHPVLPAAKNALLRVTVTVTGASGQTETLALGELDPNFGEHPAILALEQDGAPLHAAPELVVPGDDLATRSVPDVTHITVAVQSPAPTSPPSAGAISVHDGARTVVLDAHRLSLLPAENLTVHFRAGAARQTHTESGPPLALALAAAGIPSSSVAWVAAVGADGYVATVTPAEATVGGRPLILSLREDGMPLAQPRLVTDGDVKGGRYVSGVVDLVVGRTAPTG